MFVFFWSLRLTASAYPFGVFKSFLNLYQSVPKAFWQFSLNGILEEFVLFDYVNLADFFTSPTQFLLGLWFSAQSAVHLLFGLILLNLIYMYTPLHLGLDLGVYLQVQNMYSSSISWTFYTWGIHFDPLMYPKIHVMIFWSPKMVGHPFLWNVTKDFKHCRRKAFVPGIIYSYILC